MKLIRYQTQDGEIYQGWVLGDKVGPIQGDFLTDFQRRDATIPLSEVKLLTPVLPSKIICVGRNFAAHAKEHQAEVPEVPLIFLKPPSSLIAHNEKIELPPQSKQVEHEGELAVVIGKRGRWIETDKAYDFVFGYTVANDITARDLQRSDNQWTRGKGFDSFCPVGPWIETEFDPSDALITCHVNTELRQMASTRDMVFTVPQLIAFVSTFMTLEPGDILLTGTPAGVSPLSDGDELETHVEGIGTLKNFVVKPPR